MGGSAATGGQEGAAAGWTLSDQRSLALVGGGNRNFDLNFFFKRYKIKVVFCEQA